MQEKPSSPVALSIRSETVDAAATHHHDGVRKRRKRKESEPVYIAAIRPGRLAALVEMDRYFASPDVLEEAEQKRAS